MLDPKLAWGGAAASFAHVARLPERAPYGSVETKVLLRLTKELDAAVREAAQEAGVTVSEWWRRAALAALKRTKPKRAR